MGLINLHVWMRVRPCAHFQFRHYTHIQVRAQGKCMWVLSLYEWWEKQNNLRNTSKSHDKCTFISFGICNYTIFRFQSTMATDQWPHIFRPRGFSRDLFPKLERNDESCTLVDSLWRVRSEDAFHASKQDAFALCNLMRRQNLRWMPFSIAHYFASA